jgi:GR25 family glycosyltransferase involved in LPS biosynthesis
MNGVYINLTHRVDRRQHMEMLIHRCPFFKNVSRMNAIKHDRGDIGCTLSHIKALSLMGDKDEYFMILEDDFVLLNEKHFNSFTKEFEDIKNDPTWDVLTLTPRGDTVLKRTHFNIINNNQTATGYIVRQKFKHILLNNFKNGYLQLILNKDKNIYSLDQYWKIIQKDNFIYYNKIFGGQLESYSDIEKRNVNYNDRFMNQLNY